MSECAQLWKDYCDVLTWSLWGANPGAVYVARQILFSLIFPFVTLAHFVPY